MTSKGNMNHVVATTAVANPADIIPDNKLTVVTSLLAAGHIDSMGFVKEQTL
jgi:hypothetical protein